MLNFVIYTWAILNFLIGIWEVYIFRNRDKLYLDKETVWQKIKTNKTTISNFFIDGWAEYCKVDSRYIIKHYVWFLELLNAFLALLFLGAVLLNNRQVMLITILLQLINCIIYFGTLGLEVLLDERIRANMATYAKPWMYPVYYLISAIWIFVPAYIYMKM
jgi:hypothetical protein